MTKLIAAYRNFANAPKKDVKKTRKTGNSLPETRTGLMQVEQAMTKVQNVCRVVVKQYFRNYCGCVVHISFHKLVIRVYTTEVNPLSLLGRPKHTAHREFNWTYRKT